MVQGNEVGGDVVRLVTSDKLLSDIQSDFKTYMYTCLQLLGDILSGGT